MTQDTLTKPFAKLTPADVLMNLIVTVVGPMLLVASGGDIDLATATAIRAVNAYNPRNEADLIDIGQIVSFGLAAMEATRLAQRTEFTHAQAARLRANAVSLNRAAAQTRLTLQKSQSDRAKSDYTPADSQREETAIASLAEAKQRLAEFRAQPPKPAPAPSPMPAPVPATTAPLAEEQPRIPQADWHRMLARSMTTVAAEYAEDLQNLPPAERKLASLKAQALSTTASHLISGLNPMPSPEQPTKEQPTKEQPRKDPPKNR